MQRAGAADDSCSEAFRPQVMRQPFQAELDIVPHCHPIGLIPRGPTPQAKLAATVGEAVALGNLIEGILIKDRDCTNKGSDAFCSASVSC
jgi:hypothetical protein